ncbi:UNVERIFIED_CONTAM: hypothetical protein Sindi_2960900 [Sesamum indicum]
MGGGAWPFLVGGAICLVNSVNERDLSLLTSYAEVCDALRCSGPHARYTDVFNESIALADRPGSLQLLVFNEEFLVSASHQLALTTSLPFVHTARRSYRLNGPVKCSDRGDVGGSLPATSREVNLRKDHCRNLQKQTANTLQIKSGPGRGANAPVRSPPPPARANALDVRANEPPARHAPRKTERSVRRTVAPSAGCTGGGDVSRMSKRLSATDISALASMKNVAKCDTWCELQNPVNHRVFERKLRPKPLGQGTSAWASRIASPPRPSRGGRTLASRAHPRASAQMRSRGDARHDQWWLNAQLACCRSRSPNVTPADGPAGELGHGRGTTPRERMADGARVRHRGGGGQCPPPRDGRGGDAMRDAQADVPWPNGFGRNLRSKTRWFTGFCNSHQVSHFATFFIDARAEISVAESRFDIRETSPPPVHPRTGPPCGGRFVRFSLARAAPGVR